MVRHVLARLVSVAVCVLSAVAQTQTIVDAAGETIVQVVTLDPAGLPTTQILQTLAPVVPPAGGGGAVPTSAPSAPSTPLVPGAGPASTSSTSSPLDPNDPAAAQISSTTSSSIPTPQTAPTTSPEVQQGPVGAPPTTTPAMGPTVYTYTTTDGSGNTIAVVDTFTPTWYASSSFTPVSTGSILNYSQWLSMVGGGGATPSGSALPQEAQAGGAGSSRVAGAAAAWVVGVLGGAWLVVL